MFQSNNLYRAFLSGIIIFSFTISPIESTAQTADDLSKLLAALLADTPLEEDVQELCDQYGGRVTGSKANEQSVEWGLGKFKEAGVNAQKEAFEMPRIWIENITTADISGDLNFSPNVVAKSYSGTTAGDGIFTDLVDGGFGTEEDFKKLGDKALGNFVLVESDICFDVNGLFKEYTDHFIAEQLALEAGAAGIIFMSSRPRKLLYRFVASKGVENEHVLLVMGREDAGRCFRHLRAGKKLKVTVNVAAKTAENFTSNNVIAEIKGSEKPEEVIIIGSHLDSWNLGTGANDNACNIALMIDIARQMKKLNIQPKRTIRFALWNGEEQGFFGSWAYTQQHQSELDKHVMAMSVDIGSGPIIGFFNNGRPELNSTIENALKPVQAFGPYLQIPNAIVGTDNFDFMLEGVPNLVANHKPANYGPNYHAASDTFDKVDLKSLKINSAIIAAITLGFANLSEEEIKWKRQNHAEVEALIKATQIEFPMRMFNVWDQWVEGERGRKKE